jgi:hypothetical protein
VIEEAISFFDARLVFRTYFTCILAYYLLEMMYEGHVLDTDRFTSYDVEVTCEVPQLPPTPPKTPHFRGSRLLRPLYENMACQGLLSG